MPDLIERLAALHGDQPNPVGQDVVAADLRRAHAAVFNRRRRRIGIAGAATVGVLAVGSATWAATSTGHAGPQATQATEQRHPSHPSVATSPHSRTVRHPGSDSTGVKLVAYRGRQLPGYTVQQVPSGYVLQGISGSVLDVALAGDTSPLDSFVDKMVVSLDDFPAPHDGTAVNVGGKQGWLTVSDGTRILRYADGKYNVDVQVWKNIDITDDQLIQFAEGVTVLPDVQVSHG